MSWVSPSCIWGLKRAGHHGELALQCGVLRCAPDGGWVGEPLSSILSAGTLALSLCIVAELHFSRLDPVLSPYVRVSSSARAFGT